MKLPRKRWWLLAGAATAANTLVAVLTWPPPMEERVQYIRAGMSHEEVKAILREALIPTLQEPGCEALYETGRKDDPHKLVFFEVFSSAAAHEFHLEQDYTKRVFASLDGKVSGRHVVVFAASPGYVLISRRRCGLAVAHQEPVARVAVLGLDR